MVKTQGGTTGRNGFKQSRRIYWLVLSGRSVPLELHSRQLYIWGMPVRGEGTFRLKSKEMRTWPPSPLHSLNHSETIIQSVKHNYRSFWARKREREYLHSFSLLEFPSSRANPRESLVSSRFLFNLPSPRPWRFDRSRWSYRRSRGWYSRTNHDQYGMYYINTRLYCTSQ